MNRKFLPLIVLTLILSGFSACHRSDVKTEVVERYADNLPKVERIFVKNKSGQEVVSREILYFPGKKKYVEKQFDETGQPEGTWISWYENGNKNSQGTYVDGEWHGVYKVWYPNGRLHYTGQYEHGARVGVWTYYDSTGAKVRVEDCGMYK